MDLSIITKYLKLMRVHHYIKNGLVFAALACSGQMFVMNKLIAGIIAFLAFCMISSVVYIINDIRDAEKDRKHPTKCKRPIAAREISEKKAGILAFCLFIGAMACNYLVFDAIPTGLFIAYFVLNLGYSFGLKNIPILDVSLLVAGFLIRIVYGALATGTEISNWLYLTVIALSFYFALGKRRNELKQVKDGETRKVLKAYPVHFLDKNMGMCMTLANVFYALWSMDEKTVEFYNNKYMVFTVPIVLLITMKYSFDIENGADGDPVEVLLHDKTLLLLCSVYLIFMFTILYL